MSKLKLANLGSYSPEQRTRIYEMARAIYGRVALAEAVIPQNMVGHKARINLTIDLAILFEEEANARYERDFDEFNGTTSKQTVQRDGHRARPAASGTASTQTVFEEDNED